MKLFCLLSLLLTIGQAAPALANSSLQADERNGLIDHGPLEIGETLRFPRGFNLHEFSKERGMATRILKGSLNGESYVCAFAIEADSEVKFPELTHWTVASHEQDGDVTKLSFVHDTWGLLRPLEFRCAGIRKVNQVLIDNHISLPVEVPVEHISD